jgi:DNA-binding MarR family transcriptional regulator
MNFGAYRDLQLLDLIGEGKTLTQRALAKKLNVALGVTNLCLKRLARKGYIKIVNIQPRRLRYLVTPKGISEKSRLTYEYVAHSLTFYRVARRHLAEMLAPLRAAGHRRVALYGAGEVAELAYLSLQELEMELVGVYAQEGVGKVFLGGKVLGLDQLVHADFDRIVVATLDQPEQAVEDLVASGVAPEQIVTLRGRVARGKFLSQARCPSPMAPALESEATEQ